MLPRPYVSRCWIGIVRGTIAMGKVESGTVRPGMKVTLMPTRQTYKIDGVWQEETPLASARPGENVLVKIAGAGMEDVQKGFVICTNPPCRSVDKLIVQIMIMDLPDLSGQGVNGGRDSKPTFTHIVPRRKHPYPRYSKPPTGRVRYTRVRRLPTWV